MDRNHVCLETAQKLKAAGFPQDKSSHVWPTNGSFYSGRLQRRETATAYMTPDLYVAAPNAEEVSAQIEGEIKLIREGKTWYAHKPHDGGLGVGSGDSIVESLAQHWLRRQEVEQLREARELNGEPKQ